MPYNGSFDFLCRRGMLELHKSTGIESIGKVRWQIALCLLAVYIICYFSLWKGISTSGKVGSSSALYIRSMSSRSRFNQSLSIYLSDMFQHMSGYCKRSCRRGMVRGTTETVTLASNYLANKILLVHSYISCSIYTTPTILG